MGRRSAPIALVLAALVLAVAPRAALAFCSQTDYEVSTTADETDPSDGVLSLREAVAQVDADSSHCPNIRLPAGHYTLTAGTLQITPPLPVNLSASSTTDRSSAVVIDGGGSVQLLHIGTNAALSISRVTLTNAARALVNDATSAPQASVISQSTISANRIAGSGGAIVNNADLQINDSTVVDNHASGVTSAGGAIYNIGSLLLARSSLVANSADAATAAGGAVYNAGTLTVQHSTLNGNVGGDVFDVSGKIAQTQDSLYGSGCNVALTPVGAEGQSLSSDGTCAANKGDLRLGALQDNGGPTDTEMLLPGSPAIDDYSNQCGFGYDQRGVVMPQGIQCDAGAYELVQTGDLGITAPVPAVSIRQGDTAAIAFQVTSSTNPIEASLSNDAVQPTLTDVLPAGLSFAGGSTGCGASGQTVTCLPGAVTSNGTPATVTIDIRADAPGSFPDAADVSSPRPDTNAGDNHAPLTITVTAPPTPPPGPQAAINLAGKPKVHGDRVQFVLVCSNATCAGTATLLTTERLRHGAVSALQRPAATARVRTVSLASRRFSIAAGARTTLTLRLSLTGRRLLAHFHKLPARLRVRLAATTKATAALSFKRRG